MKPELLEDALFCANLYDEDQGYDNHWRIEEERVVGGYGIDSEYLFCPDEKLLEFEWLVRAVFEHPVLERDVFIRVAKNNYALWNELDRIVAEENLKEFLIRALVVLEGL